MIRLIYSFLLFSLYSFSISGCSTYSYYCSFGASDSSWHKSNILKLIDKLRKERVSRIAIVGQKMKSLNSGHFATKIAKIIREQKLFYNSKNLEIDIFSVEQMDEILKKLGYTPHENITNRGNSFISTGNYDLVILVSEENRKLRLRGVLKNRKTVIFDLKIDKERLDEIKNHLTLQKKRSKPVFSRGKVLFLFDESIFLKETNQFKQIFSWKKILKKCYLSKENIILKWTIEDLGFEYTTGCGNPTFKVQELKIENVGIIGELARFRSVEFVAVVEMYHKTLKKDVGKGRVHNYGSGKEESFSHIETLFKISLYKSTDQQPVLVGTGDIVNNRIIPEKKSRYVIGKTMSQQITAKIIQLIKKHDAIGEVNLLESKN